MKATFVVLTTLAISATLLSPSARAQEVTKINFTTVQPQTFSPLPGKADPHKKTGWWCASTVGVCLFAYPGYLGMPCQCCNIYGCFPGQISGMSSIDRPDNVAHNR